MKKKKSPQLSIPGYSAFAKLTGQLGIQHNVFLSGRLLAEGISSCPQANKGKIGFHR